MAERLPIVQYNDGSMLIPSINESPECDFPPEDEEAGGHGPQHKHKGEQPIVEWTRGPYKGKPEKGDPFVGKGKI